MDSFPARIDAPTLPYVAGTSDVSEHEREAHWRSIFSGLWGAVDVRGGRGDLLNGALYSRRSGGLTFNRIAFGNQSFERSRAHLKRLEMPFYSLTFPERGEAIGHVGNAVERLVPGSVYLLNTGLPSKLEVEREYATFNILIPTASLERRLGRQVDLFGRTIEKPAPLLEVARKIISELAFADEIADGRTSHFLSEQLLDLVAYYLSDGGRMSDDSIARKAYREKVARHIAQHYGDPMLSPDGIAHACGISRSYLYKIFADDVPIMEQVKARRLREAYRLIANNTAGQTLTQIAMHCGFASSSEFSRLFKAHFGTPPSKL